MGQRAKAAANAARLPVTPITYNRAQSEANEQDGIASRGKSIYNEKIREWAEPKEKGKFAVIDVYGGDYEIDANHAAAVSRLVKRRPEAITYTIRVGCPTAFKTGIRARSDEPSRRIAE